MTPRPPSIVAVARLANVSTATVSRVVNGDARVSQDTRLRVEQAIAALGYHGNRQARNLRTARSGLLVTLLPDFSNPFYAGIVRGIDSVARANGLHVLVCDTGASPDSERTYLGLLRTRMVDGGICLDPDTIQGAFSSQAAGLPWVACCEFDPKQPVPYVGIDNFAAARLAVQHLLTRGHHRIALINSDPRYMFARERERGYASLLAQAGIKPNAQWIVRTPGHDLAHGRAAMHGLLQLPVRRRPTAVFAVADTLALGALKALHEAGQRVPEDMALVGFDDIPYASLCIPALTTIAQPMRQLGEEAVRLLIKRLHQPDAAVEAVLLETQLIVRQST